MAAYYYDGVWSSVANNGGAKRRRRLVIVLSVAILLPIILVIALVASRSQNASGDGGDSTLGGPLEVGLHIADAPKMVDDFLYFHPNDILFGSSSIHSRTQSLQPQPHLSLPPRPTHSRFKRRDHDKLLDLGLKSVSHPCRSNRHQLLSILRRSR